MLWNVFLAPLILAGAPRMGREGAKISSFFFKDLPVT